MRLHWYSQFLGPAPYRHHYGPPPSRSHLLERHHFSLRCIAHEMVIIRHLYFVRQNHVPHVRKLSPTSSVSRGRLVFYTLRDAELYLSRSTGQIPTRLCLLFLISLALDVSLPPQDASHLEVMTPSLKQSFAQATPSPGLPSCLHLLAKGRHFRCLVIVNPSL